MNEHPETIELDGALTVREVPAVHSRHRHCFAGQSLPSAVSLAAVESADSSALALLLEWQSTAHARGANIRFESPPKGLRVIAQLTGVAPLLGWHDDRPDNDEHDHEEAR